MEHIIIEQLTNKLVRLTAEEGYQLFNRQNGTVYTEAIIKASQATAWNWTAIPTVGTEN